MLTIPCTCYLDDISQLVPRLQVIVFLNELCERYINVKLVWVRVLCCTFQLLNGLRANLEVLLKKANMLLNNSGVAITFVDLIAEQRARPEKEINLTFGSSVSSSLKASCTGCSLIFASFSAAFFSALSLLLSSL